MSSKKYHPYVFNQEQRSFVGAFEEMYQAESLEGFDSWEQDDMNMVQRKIMLALISNMKFSQVIDFGCGKGALTQSFRSFTPSLFGADIAPTAIKIAVERFPDIQFQTVNLNNLEEAGSYLRSIQQSPGDRLIVCTELLSYLSHWSDLIELCREHCDYILICLYIPENPIGFVKSFEDLAAVTATHFEIIEDLRMQVERFHIILARRR